MNSKLVMSCIVIGVVASSCGQMPVQKEDVYVPEIKKEISFTLDSSLVKEAKDGLSLVISKAELMDETYKVNECAAQVTLAPEANKAAAPAAPAQGMAGLLGGLANLAKATTETPAAPGAVGPAKEIKIIEKQFLPRNAIVFKVDIKSEINHVLGFEKSYFILKDPTGNMLRSKAIIADTNWSYTNWCATPEQSKAYFSRMNAASDIQSAMILPKDSYTAYVAFYPNNRDIQGDWKLLMYEMPVATNAAGGVTVTDHFHSKAVVKKWETTFKKSTPKGNFEKVETKEVL